MTKNRAPAPQREAELASPKILKTSSDIRRAITRLMAPGVRRVAIVAFVGKGARAYLPSPKGVEIICWPKVGGTNPVELNRLRRDKARIRFANSLHMKLYWASGRGAVVTSANLTTNALGSGNLKEFGVLLPPQAIDIDATISSLKSRPFNKADMRQLDTAHRKLAKVFREGDSRDPRIDFSEWYSHPARAAWKLDWWEARTNVFSEKSKEVLRGDFNKRAPEQWIYTSKKGYGKDDWLLTIKLTESGASVPEWQFIDYVVKLASDDPEVDDGRSYEIVQVWSARHYPSPPFTVSREFRKALREAVLEYGIARIKRMRAVEPPKDSWT